MRSPPSSMPDPPTSVSAAPEAHARAEEDATPGGNGTPERCRNCGAERVGAYCPACGQEFLEGRFTLRRFWHEFAARYLKLESGLWLTFRQMFTDPGGVARRYIEGQRQRYTNPLGYFLLAATVALLAFTLLEPVMKQRMIEQVQSTFAQNASARENMAQLFPDRDPARGYVDVMIGALKGAYTYLALFMGTVLALLLRLFQPGPKSGGRNLAETLIFVCFVVGHAVLITTVLSNAIILSGISLGNQAVQLMPMLAVHLGLCGWGAWEFYGHSAKAVAWAALAILLADIAYFLSIFGAFIVNLILHAQ